MKILPFTLIWYVMFITLHAQNITTIDLTKAKFGEVPASRIFEDVKYIRLETHKDGLLNVNWAHFYLTDKFIVAINGFSPVYLFDRETGAFVREVSSKGRGPDEYLSHFYLSYGFDETNNTIFTRDDSKVNSDNVVVTRSWKCINILTNKVESIFYAPLSENNQEIFAIHAPWFIKENVYISYCNNISGKNRVKLVVFDKEGNLIKKYPNYAEYEKKKSISMPAMSGIFYYYHGQTYFKEHNYIDTVFRVDEYSMSPHIVFKLGNKQPSYYHQNNGNYNKEKYLIRFVYESDSFVLFNFYYYTETITNYFGEVTGINGTTHTGYYDKKSKQAYISSTPDYKKSGYAATGLPISFYPTVMNKNNEMITKIDPALLWQHKDKIDPKYRQLFQDIQEDDNPIVVIAKLK